MQSMHKAINAVKMAAQNSTPCGGTWGKWVLRKLTELRVEEGEDTFVKAVGALPTQTEASLKALTKLVSSPSGQHHKHMDDLR